VFQGRKRTRSDCPDQALGQLKVEVWWSAGQVKVAYVVLLVIIYNQEQFQNLRLQDELNNELKARIEHCTPIEQVIF